MFIVTEYAALTHYHYQNNSIYVKSQLSRIIGGT